MNALDALPNRLKSDPIFIVLVVFMVFIDLVWYDSGMSGLRVYIWKGQTRTISKFLRENRTRFAENNEIDRGQLFYINRDALIRGAFMRWIADDCPPLDWCRMLYMPAESFAPTVKDSIRITIDTNETPMLESFVETLSENRSWLGRGCRISRAVPARATLAIVHAYMAARLRSWNTNPIYPHPTFEDSQICVAPPRPRYEIRETIWQTAMRTSITTN